MKEHIEILKMAANRTLPKDIDERSSISIDSFKELYDAGYIDAIDASKLSGHAYKAPKITIEGREYLSELLERSVLSRYGKTILKWTFGIIATVVGAYLIKNIVG